MKLIRIVLLALILLSGIPAAHARSHSSHHAGHGYAHSAGYGHYGSGPSDTGGRHDYARHIGSASARRLSTGWTHGHGARQTRVHDYYRHGRNGRLIHVHGYYRR